MQALLKTAPVRAMAAIIPAAVLFFLQLHGLSPGQSHLLAVFTGTIIALAVRAAPTGLIMFLSITLLALTGTLPLDLALAGFGSPTVWLIFSAFVFAQAVAQTRLGLRIAFFFISRFGSNSLSLGYAIAATNLTLAPFVPSDTSRGGIVAPVVKSVAQTLDSEPDTANARTGAYLVLVAFHTNYVASAMFLTGMVGNPLIASLAHGITHQNLSWTAWAAASSVPGLLSLILIPWLLHHLQPPKHRDTRYAREFAAARLSAMGLLSSQEKRLIVILLLTVAGWITSPWHHIDNTLVAFVGLSMLLIGRALEWQDILENKMAWEVLIWFAPILMMTDQLDKQGVMSVIFAPIFGLVHGWPWAFAFTVLAVCYFYAHYGFASLTAQISALFPAFLTAALEGGTPAGLAVWMLAFYSNLNAGITHYGTGSAPIYFSTRYVTQSRWWSIGLIVSIVNIALWIGVGPLWWHFCHFW